MYRGQACEQGVLHGRPEVSLSEDVKAKAGLCRSPQNVRGNSLWHTFQGELCTGTGTSPTNRKYVVVSKARTKLPEPFDIRHGVTGFANFPSSFQSCFVPVFLHYASFLYFWIIMYVLCHSVFGDHNFPFYFAWVKTEKLPWFSEEPLRQKDYWGRWLLRLKWNSFCIIIRPGEYGE